jgi:hypothetical protein
MLSRTGPQALLFTDPVRYFRETYCQGHGYHAEGLLKGKAEALLIVLEARGLSVSPEVRERVQRGTT